MKLKWHGHACFELTLNDGTVIVTDPFDPSVGYPVCEVRADIVLTSHGHHDHNYVESLKGTPRVIAEAGAWDIPGGRITATPCFHDDAKGAKRGPNLIFRVEADGVAVAHLGDLGHQPDTDAQKAALTGLDAMLIPIGGYYTIDTPTAVAIVNAFNPRAAIGMHFANSYCHFPVSDEKEFLRLTTGSVLPNEVEITKEAPAGRFVMAY